MLDQITLNGFEKFILTIQTYLGFLKIPVLREFTILAFIALVGSIWKWSKKHNIF